MSFGKDLWDQVPVIESYAEHGVQFMEKINDFMKQILTIQADAARNMQKVTKQHKEEISRKLNEKVNSNFNKAVLGSTLSQTWMLILNETEAIANYKLEVCDKIEADVRKNIKHRAKDNEKINKQYFDDIRKASGELKKTVDNLEKVQQRYEKAMKDMDAAKEAYEKVSADHNSTKKIIDQHKLEADKKATAAQEASIAYKQCMIQSNELKNKHFDEILPNLLDCIQGADMDNRTTFCQTALRNYVDFNISNGPKVEKSYQLMSDTVNNINGKADMELFIRSFQSNDPLPKDFFMSDTQETENSKKTFLRGLSKTREDTYEDQIEDQIVVLPAKQGRKKAVDRAKIHEKEVAEVEKKRQGIESLIHAHKEKSAAGDTKVMDDLVEQKLLLERRIDTLMMKRHKLLVYVATVDGVSPPDAPIAVQNRVTTASPLTISNFGTPSVIEMVSKMSPSQNSFSSIKPTQSPTGNAPLMPLSSSICNPGMEKLAGGPIIDRCKVVFEFEAAAGSQEMSVKAGLVLDVIEKQDDGWWRCRYDGKEGYVPGNYTEPV
ncbi:hypothetical protein BDV3_000285 [Batrachochytrium dendrobatidis]|uniref:SH3 domain-containing protein n=1 Tax=Batrachochytrium dendrobatidis (strain JEL423) TaxID=403673 RepID=A0A177WAX5_BATDL|nr:Formin-binding protein 1 [Batrachochytrium dendrobatidis]KAK5667934.1 Formin-binding protein 1 [Batrachochytrium dendrobatidis]OAJ37258.1 hypothetical protein BDEG_21303 [Batrachochytrium dendrobatidis JEL423]